MNIPPIDGSLSYLGQVVVGVFVVLRPVYLTSLFNTGFYYFSSLKDKLSPCSVINFLSSEGFFRPWDLFQFFTKENQGKKKIMKCD